MNIRLFIDLKNKKFLLRLIGWFIWEFADLSKLSDEIYEQEDSLQLFRKANEARFFFLW